MTTLDTTTLLSTLRDYEDRGLVRSVRAPDRPLTLWCYTHTAQFSRTWDDVTTVARGLVLADDGSLVARPLPKFFGLGDPLAGPLRRDPFTVYDKMDGSLILVSEFEGELVVTTKGSFTTTQAEAAKALLTGWSPLPGTTALFEFLAPWNRIVVDYGDFEGLVLLGAVSHDTGFDSWSPHEYAELTGWWGEVVVSRRMSLETLVAMVQDPEAGPNREGFVLVWEAQNGPALRLKAKFAQYLELHGTMTMTTNRTVWEALSTGTLEQILAAIPDELYDKVQGCVNGIMSEYDRIMHDAQQVAQAALGCSTRGEAAELVRASDVDHRVAFKLLDGKDPAPIVWRLVRPKNSERLW